MPASTNAAHQYAGNLGEIGRAISTLPVSSTRPPVVVPLICGPSVDGVTTGGRSLLTGSVEIARPISPKYPAYWWAAFVDAGNAADRPADLKPAFGYGVGLRWRSPVGPLRADVAYGHDVQQLRLHVSVGIAF